MKTMFSLVALLFLSFPVFATVSKTTQSGSADAFVRRTTSSENSEALSGQRNQLPPQTIEARRLAEQKTIQTHREALFDNRNDPAQGSENSQLTIVYFFDYNCSFCERQDAILHKIMKAFPQVRVVYKDMPILTESSLDAAKMALAVHRQSPERYSDIHRRLLSKPGSHNSRSIQAAIKAEGFDPDLLKQAIGPDISQHINQNLAIADELGIHGAPAMVFSDYVVAGSLDERALTDLIQTYLQGQDRHRKTAG